MTPIGVGEIWDLAASYSNPRPSLQERLMEKGVVYDLPSLKKEAYQELMKAETLTLKQLSKETYGITLRDEKARLG